MEGFYSLSFSFSTPSVIPLDNFYITWVLPSLIWFTHSWRLQLVVFRYYLAVKELVGEVSTDHTLLFILDDLVLIRGVIAVGSDLKLAIMLVGVI